MFFYKSENARACYRGTAELCVRVRSVRAHPPSWHLELLLGGEELVDKLPLLLLTALAHVPWVGAPHKHAGKQQRCVEMIEGKRKAIQTRSVSVFGPLHGLRRVSYRVRRVSCVSCVGEECTELVGLQFVLVSVLQDLSQEGHEVVEHVVVDHRQIRQQLLTLATNKVDGTMVRAGSVRYFLRDIVTIVAGWARTWL